MMESKRNERNVEQVAIAVARNVILHPTFYAFATTSSVLSCLDLDGIKTCHTIMVRVFKNDFKTELL